MNAEQQLPVVSDELDLIESLVDLSHAKIVELGCGAARLARDLLRRHAASEVVGIDPDERQLARNRAEPQERLTFISGGADAIPFGDASFDGAMMLKSLHHVPVDLMDHALTEIARVLRPRGWLYISEPVFAGKLNELVRLFNDERVVRDEAQRAVDRAIASGRWSQAAERRFDVPVSFDSFADFEKRMIRTTFADHDVGEAQLGQIRDAYALQAGGIGALRLTRPMHVRVLRIARAGD
jgi:SAM-dependent methyltransferase